MSKLLVGVEVVVGVHNFVWREAHAGKHLLPCDQVCACGPSAAVVRDADHIRRQIVQNPTM